MSKPARIKGWALDWIRENFRPGQRFFAKTLYRALNRTHGVSRASITRVMGELRDDGVIALDKRMQGPNSFWWVL